MTGRSLEKRRIFFVSAFLLAAFFVFFGKRTDKNQQNNLNSPSVEIKKVDFEHVFTLMPGASSKYGVQVHSKNNWQVWKSFPDGHLEIFHEAISGDIKRLNLSADWMRDTYPMLFITSGERMYIAGYDVVENVPSGRSLSVKQPGYSLYELSPSTKGEPKLIAKGLDFGGIDSILYGRAYKSHITLCAENKCVDVGFNGKVRAWELSSLSKYEFIELLFDENKAYALIRKTYDDRIDGEISEEHARFYLAQIAPSSTSIQPVADIGTPYNLQLINGMIEYELANKKEDFARLLSYELSRMPNNGLINFGDNNLEGRIAWGSVYYLSGLISVLEGEGLGILSADMLDDIHKRVVSEIELIAKFAENDYPGYRVKRYSINREPLLFALHLSRIAEVLKRAENLGLESGSVKKALTKIRSHLTSLEYTVEHKSECILLSGKCETLAYREGYPFWADGVNVPFNFISGYVNGLLAVSSEKAVHDFAFELMRPLRSLEEIDKHPTAWKYWAFEGQNGWAWQEGRSSNTAEWQGNNKGLDIAHITYRSMDAMALLNTSRMQGDEHEYIKSLVARGMLLPSVNEWFYRYDEVAKLDKIVARRYSRVSSVWELQSQVWALHALSNSIN